MNSVSTGAQVAAGESRGRQSSLRRGFWGAILLGIIVLVTTARPEYPESALGGSLVFLCTLLPAGLWIYGLANGLPLFPAFAISYAWAFGLPLLYEHPIVSLYSPGQQLIGALTVCGFISLGTAIWFAIARRPVTIPARCLQLNSSKANSLFVSLLAAATLGSVLQSTIAPFLPSGTGSIVTAIILAIDALACFVLSYELGRQRLDGATFIAFVSLLTAVIIVNLATLLLVGAMSLLVVAVFGYTVGARRFPWAIPLLALATFGFLHLGKGAIRDKYWGHGEDSDRSAPSLREYPNIAIDWVAASLAELNAGPESSQEEGQSLLERASLMQLLLYVQSVSPADRPYLNGETYKVIPTLLIPRVFMPNKPASHEGTYLLNIYYGFQTREATETTTIGFGLLNEAFANFGYLGVGGLALLLGAFYGMVGRWAGGTPIFSFRTLFAIVVASYSFQTEYAAGVYVAALFQSTVALFLLAAMFMRPTLVDRSMIPTNPRLSIAKV